MHPRNPTASDAAVIRTWRVAAVKGTMSKSFCEVQKMPPRTNSVGLIGIGLLGQALARRLLGAAFEVVGFDVDAAKLARFSELGGDAAATVAEIARRCD